MRVFTVRCISARALIPCNLAVLGFAFAQPVLAETSDDASRRDVITSEIVVLGKRGSGYAIDHTSTATRTGTELMDVPQSIQVVPRAVIDDQQLVDLTSVLRNVSGIQAGTNAGNRSESFTIRGFRSSYYAIDSIMLSPAVETNDGYRDLANVERIEVLKGPASVLYGRGDPGGLINIVTKQPRFENGVNFSLQGGTDSLKRGQFDITGPVDDGRTLAFRLIGVAQDGDTFRDVFEPFRRQFGASSFLWQPSESTRVISSLTYLHQETQSDRGLVATPVAGTPDRVVDLPQGRYLGEAFATLESSHYELNYRIEHDLTDWLTVRQIGHYDEGKLNLFGINYGNASNVSGVVVNRNTGQRTVMRSATRQDENNHNQDYQADLVAKVSSAGLDHTIVFGGEYSQAYRFRTFATATLAPINIDHPVYGASPGIFVPRADRTVRAEAYSAYLQDQIDIGKRWSLIAGVRHDQTQQSDFGTTEFKSDEGAWSPRAGVVWKPSEQMALFADYTRSFQSKPEPTATGAPLPPETGEQYEVGVKGELLDERLTFTSSVYRLTRAHVAQQDTQNIGFNIDAGVQRSRGIELDVTGSVTREIKVIASGAIIDAKVIRSTDFDVGNRLLNVPKRSGSLWATWEPLAGVLHGAGVGSGIFAASDRAGDLENSFSIGGYTRLDASLWYALNPKIRLSLNMKNLTDEYYIDSSVSQGQIAPGEKRSVLLGINGSF